MSYQDDLNSEEWRNKRKEILLRDKLRCIKCHNRNVIEGCSVGILIYKGLNDDGKLFNYLGYNSEKQAVKKKVFIKNECELIALISSQPYIAYADFKFEKDSFLNVIAVRESRQINNDRLKINRYELPLTFLLDDRFMKMADNLKEKINGDDKWNYVQGLHVHHTYYQINLKPWEYPNSSLQTLCWICHEQLHKNEKIPCLDQNGKQFERLEPCSKCFGAGWFPEFKHIENGICFQCRGARYIGLVK